VRLADGARYAARLLVAADGRGSPLREAAGIASVAWRSAQLGIVTCVGHEGAHGGRAVQHFLPSGPFAILPLTGRRSCVTWTEEEASAQAILALAEDGFREEVERRFDYRLGGVTHIGPRAAFALDMHLARALIGARFALIGDAAHAVHPIAGQGLNLALRDVAAMAEVVADAARLGLDFGTATVLEGYQRWRRLDAALSAGVFDALNRLFSTDATVLRTVRGVGLGLLERMPALKQLLVAEAAGLTGDVPRLLRGEPP
jgi:2-octaprenyl-6-methoxyphenol hydroxylase